MRARFPILFAAFFAVLFVLAPARAHAFTPPPFDDYVVDTAGKLSPADKRYFHDKLSRYEEASGNQIAVFVTKSLEGESIDDVGYETAKAWGVGQKEKDNGVLLVIAPNERKIRIDTGKGVGGLLTDLESNDIIRRDIGPRLRVDDFRGGIDAGIDAIIERLGGIDGGTPAPRAQRHAQQAGIADVCSTIAIVLVLLVVIIVIARSRGGRGGGGGGPPFIFFGGGGGGGGGGDWGGGGFGGGGGGDFGGGGSSDSY